MNIEDWGRLSYRDAWQRQKDYVAMRIEDRSVDDMIAIVEHNPVYTLGFHGNEENLLASEDMLQKIGAECIRIERGGDVTYHGPGQCVIYPLLDLHRLRLGAKAYVNILEQSVIDFLSESGISATRDPHAPGVWLNPESPERARKICALGVKISRGLTMHGLALNINTDLAYFRHINPCGFADKGVTSMEIELGHKINDFSAQCMRLAKMLSEKLQKG